MSINRAISVQVEVAYQHQSDGALRLNRDKKVAE